MKSIGFLVIWPWLVKEGEEHEPSGQLAQDKSHMVHVTCHLGMEWLVAPPASDTNPPIYYAEPIIINIIILV